MAVLSRNEFYEQYDAARQQGMNSHQAVNYLAQAAVAAQPKADPQPVKVDTWQPTNNLVRRSSNNSFTQPAYQQPTYDTNAALKNLQNIAATTTDKQLAKMITKYTSGDTKKDNFWGQTAASFGSGKINELLNQAWGRYAEDGKAESKAVADAYSQLAEYYQNVNAEALDDKNRKAKWISQDMAQYAPQFLEQTKASAAPILGGAAAGAVIGEMVTPIPGADALIGALAGGVKGAMGGTVAGTKVGGLIGAGKYSYNTMRGAAMKSLLEAGATTEQAQEASRDEAIISTAIENLDNATDLFLLIPGMGGMGKAAAKTALGKFAEWAGNVAQEGGEEFIQELISIANERRVKNGTTGDGAIGLAKEVMALGQEIAKDAKNSDDLKQALEAARGGAVIGGFMGPTGAAINKVITGPMQNTALNAINDLAPNQKVAQQNRNYIAESNADSRAREEVSDYIRSTNGLSNEEPNVRTKAYSEYAMQLDQAKRNDVLVDGDGKLVGQVKGIAGTGFTLQTKGGSEAVFRSEASGSLDKNGAIYKALQSGGEFISEKEYAERQAQAEAQVAEAAKTAPAAPEMPTPEMATQEQLVQEAPAEMPSETPVSALENEGTSIADEAPESSTMQSDELVGQANEEAAQYVNNRNADSSYRGIPVRIKPSKDGTIKVSVAKPRANGIGYTKQFTQIGTAKSVAEANQMIKSYFSTVQNTRQEVNATVNAEDRAELNSIKDAGDFEIALERKIGSNVRNYLSNLFFKNDVGHHWAGGIKEGLSKGAKTSLPFGYELVVQSEDGNSARISVFDASQNEINQFSVSYYLQPSEKKNQMFDDIIAPIADDIAQKNTTAQNTKSGTNIKAKENLSSDDYYGDEVAFIDANGNPMYWDMRDQNHDQLLGDSDWSDRYGLRNAINNGYIRVKPGYGIELSIGNGRLSAEQESGLERVINGFSGDTFYVDFDDESGSVGFISFEGADINPRTILSRIDRILAENQRQGEDNSTKNIKAKERLSDNDELALLEGGSTKHSRQVKAQSSSEALTPSEISALSNREVNQRLNKYAALARTAATGDNAVDVLLNFLGGNMKPETSVQNVNKAFYEQSLMENVLNDYDEDYVPSTDGKSTFQPTEEQIREILALIERKQTAAQEYREKKNNEESNPIPPDERKGREKPAEVDKTFGALAEDAEIPEMFLPDEDSNTDLPYDPNKVKEFMAERNNDNVTERLELLRGLFPDADFRISHDADYTLDERASLPSDYLNADEYDEDEQRNKSNGEAFIEVVRGHETYGALGESPTKGDKYEKSWMKQHGWADAISTWKEEGNDRRQVYASFELIPNGHIDSKTGEWTPNKSLTDVKEDGRRGNRNYTEALVVTKPDGTRQVYYLKSKEGMYRHIINSNINEGITKVIQRHEAKVRELEQRINRGYEFAEHPNQFLDSKDINANTSEKALQLVKKLEKELEAEKNWLGGLDYKPEGTYTLAKFFADNKGVVTQEDKDLVKSYLNEDIGRDINGFSFQGLGNSMSKEFAMELIDSILKEAPDGQAQYNESFNAGKTSAGSQNPADFRTAEGRQPSSISERREPFDLRVVNGAGVIENAPAQASSPDLRRSSGTGEIMDDTGTVRTVSGETSGLQARNISDSEITELANRATQDINDAFEEPVTIRKRGGQPGRTLQAKQLNSELFLDGNAVGEINPSSYSGRLQQVAAAIKKAAQEYGLATVQLNGTLIRQHTAKDGSNYTSRLNAYADLNEGFIAIGELTEENASQILNDALHEITHGVTDSYFGADNEQAVMFVSGIAEKCKIKDFEKKIQKVIDAYSDNGTFDSAVADELISRFAEGDDCGGMFTQAELEKLQDALLNSSEWKEATGNSDYYNQLTDFSRTQLRNRIEPEALSKARPGTDVGYDIAKSPTQETPTKTYYPMGERETNRTLSERTQQLTNDAMRALVLGDFDKAQELLKQASSLPKNADNGMYSDEMVDMYQSSQKKAFRAKEDLSFTDDKEADIEDVMRMIEEDRKKPSLADYKASRDAMDAESRAETTREIEESFDEHRETNPEARKATQAERFGVKGDDNPLNLAKKVAEQSAKLKEKSVLNNDRKRAKMFGENKAAQRAKARFNGYMDVLSKAANAEANVAELFTYANTLKDDPEMGVYVNEKVLNNLRKAAQLEEESAQTPTPDVVNAYKYQATKAMAMAAQQAENVDRVQSTIQSGLIEAALKYSKGNTDNVLVKGAQWLNRMQLNPGNFFRMIGGYDKRSRNTGYAMQQRVDRQNAVRITTEARLKDFFSGIKNDKQYRDFASGKTKSDVVMGDHKLSMLQAVQFKMLCDTLGIDDIRTSRLETLNGFALRDAGGNDNFIEMEGNTQAERYAWASQLYDQAVKSINGNSAAKAYMEAAAKMFEDVKPDLVAVGEKVDGFPKAMYAEGKYLPLSYASKDGHPMDWTLTNDMASGLSTTRIMQERVRENGGYAVIKPVSQTVDSYISQAANYIAYAELGNDLSIMGDANSLYGSLQNTIAKNFGDTYAQWLTNYTNDVNQIKSTDPTGLNKVLAKARTMMQQGALLGSLSVPIKQISSYFSAMGVVDPRAVMKAYSPIRRSGNNIIDYLYKSRLQGSIDPDVSQALNSGWVDKLKKSGKLGAAVVNATNIMDSRTVANVYQACCYDVEMNSGLSMDEIYKDGDPKKGLTNAGELLVHSLFSEAVLNTQPIFNRQARAEIARTSSEALRMLSVFRTQQTQNYNRLLTTINEAKAAKKFSGDTKSAGREMRQTIGGQVAAAASISALTILADMLLHKHKKYKDDDDEFDEGKILDRFALNFVEAGAGTALFAGDATKWLIDQIKGNTGDYASNKEFYGISMGAISSLRSAMNAWTWLYSDMLKGGKHAASDLRYAVNYTATLLGIPTQNAYNLMNSFYQYTGDILGKDIISGYGSEKYEDAMKEWDAIRNDFGNKLYSAVRAGNTAKAKESVEQMGDKFLTMIKTSSMEQLKSGDADDDEVLNVLMTYGNRTAEEAADDVMKMHLQIDTGYTSLTGTGKQTAETAYADGKIDRAEFKKLYTKYSGKTPDQAEYSINRIDFKQKYPGNTYQDIKKMYMDGKLPKTEAAEWRYKTQENTTKESAENWVKNLDFQKMTGYEANYTSTSDLYDTYETKEKLGVISFYDKYGKQFSSPKAFGDVFNYLNNNERTNYPTYKTSYGETSKNQSRVITLMNELIQQKKITYDMAKKIWAEHYGWSTGNRSAWVNVKG